MKNYIRGTLTVIALAFASGCTKPDTDAQAAERARLQGREQAKAELEAQIKQKDDVIQKVQSEARASAEQEFQVQIANQAQLIEKARAEGRAVAEEQLKTQLAFRDQLIEQARVESRAQAEEELKTQLEHKDQLIEQARAEGRAQAEEQLRLENGALESKSKAMEQDLAIRHRFYQAVGGTYEGTFKTDRGNFNFRIALVPSLPPYPASRVRQLEELTSDLNNLYFNAQVIQWSASNALSSVGCRVENIRADLINGSISIASSSCPNLYKLSISEMNYPSRDTMPSKEIASEIRDGKIVVVDALVGEIRPTTNAMIYEIFASRKGN